MLVLVLLPLLLSLLLSLLLLLLLLLLLPSARPSVQALLVLIALVAAAPPGVVAPARRLPVAPLVALLLEPPLPAFGVRHPVSTSKPMRSRMHGMLLWSKSNSLRAPR